MEPDYYGLLGVAPDAGEGEIRAAFRGLVQDAMEDQPRFAALTEAFEILKDPEKRSAYDAWRAGAGERTAAMGAAAEPTQGMSATAMGTATVAMGTATAAMPAADGRTVGMTLPPCPACGTPALPGEIYCPECGLLAGSTPGAAPSAPVAPPTLADAAGRTWTLHPGQSVVGRDGADVVLADQTVSRRHARLTVDAQNTVTLEDLGSTNGTRYGGAPLAPGRTVALGDGMALRFGAVALTVHIPSAPRVARAALPAGPQAERAPVAAIEGSAGAAARLVAADGTVHTLKSTVTVFGRREGCDVVLRGDAFVSGQHARIAWEDGGFHLTDLGSTNGTRVAGRKIAPRIPVPLTDGDTIHLGQTQFTFHAPK